MKQYRYLYFPLLMVVLVALDQWSKLWIVKHIPLGSIHKGLPPIFS